MRKNKIRDQGRISDIFLVVHNEAAGPSVAVPRTSCKYVPFRPCFMILRRASHAYHVLHETCRSASTLPSARRVCQTGIARRPIQAMSLHLQREVTRYLFERDPLRLGDEQVDVKQTNDQHSKKDEHDQGTDPTT